MSEHAAHPDRALWSLLAEAVDYAGLFPPAQLDMPGAVAEYESYLASSDVWALGRFVVPASRLEELAAVASADHLQRRTSLGNPRPGGRLSAVLGADVAADVERVKAFNAGRGGDDPQWWSGVDAIELRASTLEAVANALRIVPGSLERYVEIPIAGDATALVRAIGDAGAFAKVRTGGTTAEVIPTSEALVRFLATCVNEQVPFKATAGLHHPLRGEYPLTYEPGSACARMYGFLNVFLATAFLRAGLPEDEARRLIEEHDPAAVRFDERHVSWRGHRLGVDELAATRNVLKSFGSCSFREPVDDLTALGML